MIDVLGSRSVSAEQNASPSQVLDVVARNRVFLRMEIEPDRPAPAVGKVALFDGAILGSPKPDECVALVVHVPIVLQPGVIRSNQVALAMHEG